MGLTVVWCDEWVRLDPRDGRALDDDGGAPAQPPIRLAAVRNEYVSCQLLVGPVKARETVAVSGQSLTGPDTARLAPSVWEPFLEWYHEIDGTWYPDALLPQAVTGGSTPVLRKDNGVRGQRHAGFWLDLFVPADAKPGAYSGAVTVTAGAERLSVPVELEVLAGRIGDECTIDVSLNNYADSISGGWPDVAARRDRFTTEKYRRVEQGVFRTAHEHRAFLHYLPYTHAGYVYGDFAPPLAGEGNGRHIVDWTDWDRHFGPYFDGSAFRGTRRGASPVPRFWLPINLCWPADFVKFGRPGYAAEWRAVGKQMVEHFRKKRWTRTRFDLFLNHKQRYRFFPWDAEEARFLGDQDLHRTIRAFWEGTFDWKSARPVRFQYTLGTTWTYGIDIQSDLAQFIDVFIAGTDGPAWFHEHTPRLKKAGRQVWSCTRTGDIDESTRATAYVPLMAWMRDLDGFMPRWNTMGGFGDDPYHAVPGKGGITFLYPGARFGSEATFPSLRLKVLRNAMQVIETLRLAAKGARRSAPSSRPRGGGPAAVKRKVNRLLGVARGDWFPKRPAYVTEKLPKDWTGADFATEEPPLAGWQQFSPDAWRALRQLALTMVSER